MSKDTIDLVFSFDTTGSMYPCLTQVRRYVKETVQELFNLIPNIRIGIITHGDYCDNDNCITSLDLTDNERAITKFIEHAPATNGGDTPECYELVLNHTRSMTWQSKRNKALVLIGDDVPHPKGYNYRGLRNDLDWANEAQLLIEAGISILPVQALGRWHASYFYESLADMSDSPLLELPQFNDITDIILAICHQRAGTLTNFEETLRERHKPASWHVMANVDRLAGRKVRTRPRTSTLDDTYTDTLTTHRAGLRKSPLTTKSPTSYMGYEAMKDAGKKLVSVHPSRFQILDIGEEDQTVNQFTRDNGLEFRKGRGFYEFTKPETIQAYKEIILEDPTTGRLFTGNKARIIIGLPIGKEIKYHPEPTKYTVFIQSTSANRRLKANTRFLYELPDPELRTETTEPHSPAKATTATRRKTAPKTTPKTTRKCTQCGKPGHNRRTCPARTPAPTGNQAAPPANNMQ